MRSNKASEQVVKEIYMCPTQESDEDGQFDRSGPMQIDSMSFAMVAEEIELGYKRRNVLKNVEARRSSLVEQGDF